MPAVGRYAFRDLPHVAEGLITKFRFVKQGTTQQGVVQSAGNDDVTLGVALFDVIQADLDTAQNAMTVRYAGESELEIGAAVTLGAQLMSDTSGRAVPATTGHRVVAVAMQAGTNVGDRITATILGLNGHVL